jgi:hypothetical protein
MLSEPQTVTGSAVQPYLHIDNRGLIVWDGQRGVVFAGALMGWVRETIELLLDEKRATRHRGDHYLGGWVDEAAGVVTVYAGPESGLVSLQLPVDVLAGLRDRLRG